VLQVLGGVSLGPQQRVVTVQVGQGEEAVCLVLGVAGGSITALHQMALPSETVDPLAPATPKGSLASFAERLASFRQQDPHAR
jgi:flagellar protein FliO/FliZ